MSFKGSDPQLHTSTLSRNSAASDLHHLTALVSKLPLVRDGDVRAAGELARAPALQRRVHPRLKQVAERDVRINSMDVLNFCGWAYHQDVML